MFLVHSYCTAFITHPSCFHGSAALLQYHSVCYSSYAWNSLLVIEQFIDGPQMTPLNGEKGAEE